MHLKTLYVTLLNTVEMQMMGSAEDSVVIIILFVCLPYADLLVLVLLPMKVEISNKC